MRTKILLGFSVITVSLLSATASIIMRGPVAKKYIACGHEFGHVTPSNLLARASAFEGFGIDGTLLGLRAPMQSGGDAQTYLVTRDMRDWPVDVFAADIPYLQKITSSTTFKELFIRALRMPRKRISWTNDVAWKTINGHLRAIARTAKQGGCRGLHIDHEDYFGAKQFVRIEGDLPWDELSKLVRQRGRDMFSIVFEEFPDAVLFFYRYMVADPAFWNSYSTAIDPQEAMRLKGDLWIPFVNGMLDVMPWSAKAVEGDETGYRYESKYNWFHLARTLQRKCTLAFIDPKHHDKFRARTSTSFPVYFDAYTDDCFTPDTQYYRGAVEGSRAVHLERNLAQATDASDEYVWLYGEKRTWIKWDGAIDHRIVKDGHTWPEVFVGICDVLNANRDPKKFLDNCLQKQNSFEDAFKGNYSFWSRKKDRRVGTFEMDTTFGNGDKSSYKAIGVEEGCFLCSVPAKCGEYFAVTFSVKNGTGSWARAGYESINKDLNAWLFPGHVVKLSESDANGWRKGAVLMRVPELSNGLNFNTSVKLAENECAWLDDVHFYKVIPLLTDGNIK